jgi:hypothetical protein
VHQWDDEPTKTMQCNEQRTFRNVLNNPRIFNWHYISYYLINCTCVVKANRWRTMMVAMAIVNMIKPKSQKSVPQLPTAPALFERTYMDAEAMEKRMMRMGEVPLPWNDNTLALLACSIIAKLWVLNSFKRASSNRPHVTISMLRPVLSKYNHHCSPRFHEQR